MRFRFGFSSLVATVLILVAATNAQVSKSQSSPMYRAGGLSFAIPAPNADLIETGSDYRVLLEPYAPNSNRLIAAFVPPGDLTALQAGKAPLSKQYAMVEIPRTAEFVNVNDELFKQIRQSLSQQFEGNLEANVKKGEGEVNQKEKAITGKEGDVKIDKPTQLGRFFTKPNADAYGMILPVSENGITLQRAMSLAIIKVNNRVLFTYLYIDYKDEDTIKQLRATVEQWTDAILGANK